MLRERRRHANFKPNRKLDQKSSRGMIYENEELRLRTININAEVERGQSDIKKLRRENDQLRKEIWSLRDEYDRLDKLLRESRKKGVASARDTTGATAAAGAGRRYSNDKCDSCNQSIMDDDSCDEDDFDDDDDEDIDYDDDEDDDDDVDYDNENEQDNVGINRDDVDGGNAVTKDNSERGLEREKLRNNVDHLSIVSEENMSGIDETQSYQYSDNINATTTNNNHPINDVNAQCAALTDFQSIVPPLAHFENLIYEDIGPNLDSSGKVRYNSDSTIPTGETVIPAKEWDFSRSPPPPPAHDLNANSNSTINTTATNYSTVSDVFHSRSNFAPDICMNNVLATMSPAMISTAAAPIAAVSSINNGLAIGQFDRFNSNNFVEPIYAEIKRVKSTTASAATPTTTTTTVLPQQIFQTGGNLDDLLQDIEQLSKDLHQMQCENQYKYPTRQVDHLFELNSNRIIDNNDETDDNDDDDDDDAHNIGPAINNRCGHNSKSPPYRSEMNLLLSFDGNTHTITTMPIQYQSTQQLNESNAITPLTVSASSLNMNQNDAPIVDCIKSASSLVSLKTTRSTGMEPTRSNSLAESPSKQIQPSESNSSINLASTVNANTTQSISTAPLATTTITTTTAATTTTTTASTPTPTTTTTKLEQQPLHQQQKPPQPPPSPPSILSTRRKSRRISIYFNGKKNPDKSQSTEQIPTKNNTILKSPSNYRKMSQDSMSMNPNAATIKSLAATSDVSSLPAGTVAGQQQLSQQRLKKLRRHSEGGQYLRTTGGSIDAPPPQQQQLHPHNMDSSRPSISERTSGGNSQASSSRESSTSLNANKLRKISISSQHHHKGQQNVGAAGGNGQSGGGGGQQSKSGSSSSGGGGGKIPWCACWGNGCL